MSTFTWAIPGRSGAGSTKSDDPKRRRKIQNRLNQRARRLRLQQKNKRNNRTGDPPFRVHRWKLDDPDETDPTPAESEELSGGRYQQYTPQFHLAIRPATPTSVDSFANKKSPDSETSILPARRGQSRRSKTCLTSDLLLTMIQRNVLRAGYHNSYILQQLVFAFSPAGEPQMYDRHFPIATIVPVGPGLPEGLVPTELQRNTPHQIWMNGFPCPRMRDNLIRWQYTINCGEFLRDLMGDLVQPEIEYFPATGTAMEQNMLAKNQRLALSGDEEDDYTASRHGLIVWGEPYLLKSWEVTPAFVRKWACIVEGCDDLIRSSNLWRESRGEEPLRMTELKDE